MPTNPAPTPPVALAAAVKRRPRNELVMRLIHPLTRRGVALLARGGVEPWQVVVAHTIVGLGACVLIAGSGPPGWVVAAVLLQVKTLLDNVDGGLARATDRVTELGRYLDTILDLLVNVALFAALAVHGPPVLAALALLVLTAVLSYDFNAERLYRAAHGEAIAAAEPVGVDERDDSPVLRLFRTLYRTVLGPQDAAITALDARLFRHASQRDYAFAPASERRAWSDIFSTAALVNLGLSSQYVLLAVCLIAAQPFAYAYLVLAQGVYVVFVQALRVRSYRKRVAPRPSEPPRRR